MQFDTFPTTCVPVVIKEPGASHPRARHYVLKNDVISVASSTTSVLSHCAAAADDDDDVCFIVGLFFLLCVSCCRHSMGLCFVFDVMDRENRMAVAESLQDQIRDNIQFQSCVILYSIPFNATADIF